MKCNSYESFFEVISNRSRIEIISLLNQKPMCVNELSEELGEEQSKVSHNLKKMAQCHFVTVKQNGKKRYYSLNHETITPLLNIVEKHVKKHCCENCIKTTTPMHKKIKNKKRK